ncbi:MAG TPA: energy transducer TonB [Bryobacteraceae bacterium]|nr:energy transducer TonB [Bryobacteraceae bacterium]
MFEQTLCLQHSKRWTFAASLTLQSAVGGAAILLSLTHVEMLPAGALKDLIRPLPPTMRAVEIVPAERTSGRADAMAPRNASSRIFREPARIPTAIARIDDLGSAPAIEYGADTGKSSAAIGDPTGVARALDLSVGAPPPEAKVVPAAPTRIPVGGDVMEAQIIKRVMPLYPPLARQARVSGLVQLIGVIAQDGTIQQLQVLSGHPLLVRAALEAVRQWVYRPTMLNGKPVEVIAPIRVYFSLHEP